MEETRRAPRQAPDHLKEKERDWYLFVTLSQCLCCLCALLLLFFCSRGNSSRAQGLRADWAQLLSRSWTVEDVRGAVDVLREYWTPQGETAPVMAQPDEATTESPSAPAASTENAAPETAEDTADESASLDTENAQTQPTTPETTALSAAGGSDQSGKAAQKNTSFSPSAVTVPITRPVAGGRYSSYFGYRNNPITHRYAFHTGLDIAVPTGTAIRAAYGGTVRLVGEDDRSGKYVTITHDDGYETFYCHCSETLVTQGTVVRAGEAVAKVGATGWATGPHLHFEIRKNGTKLDPLQILERDA